MLKVETGSLGRFQFVRCERTIRPGSADVFAVLIEHFAIHDGVADSLRGQRSRK